MGSVAPSFAAPRLPVVCDVPPRGNRTSSGGLRSSNDHATGSVSAADDESVPGSTRRGTAVLVIEQLRSWVPVQANEILTTHHSAESVLPVSSPMPDCSVLAVLSAGKPRTMVAIEIRGGDEHGGTAGRSVDFLCNQNRSLAGDHLRRAKTARGVVSAVPIVLAPSGTSSPMTLRRSDERGGLPGRSLHWRSESDSATSTVELAQPTPARGASRLQIKITLRIARGQESCIAQRCRTFV